jgi:hypothetical protein
MLKGKLQFAPPKLTMFFGLNTKVLIFAIYPTKLQNFFFSIRPILSQNSHIAPIFLFFINIKKKTNLGVEKCPNSHPKFFL